MKFYKIMKIHNKKNKNSRPADKDTFFKTTHNSDEM